MFLSLPDSKIQSISLSAQTLLNQPKVSLRKLNQFIGMCNVSRTAVLEAPLHYRSIQNQLISTLRSQPITHQNYDVKICLNGQSRKDLTWWVKNLKTNCSRPIHPPPVDLSIMSDASDLAWGAHLASVRIQGFWRSYEFSWHINRKELKAAFLALKFLIPNQTNVHVQICIDNRTAVVYINHLGGTRALELNSIAVKMWVWCPFSSLCTRDIEQNCRFASPPETRINRMDVKFQNFQTNSKCLQNASSRHLCIRPKSPSSKVFLLDSGSTSRGNECILSKLEQRSPLHVSSLQSDSKMSSENNQRLSNCSFNNTSLAVKTMVSHNTESPI